MIRVEAIGKRYRLGGTARYDTLRDAITRLFTRRTSSPRSDAHFWALRDVSFDVPEGEVVGVVGRNGAGKSTLLKLLSRITLPTEGCIRLGGRVASLLEVGTGFHAELSGRENIFMNGAILGMTRREIQSRFDEIVDFAEIGEFIDTPIKRYSSGMHVRLAFAVAAHLEPEILLVDEVLAVGDAEFQKKCLGRMGDVARSGRTVLLVSHNMAAIQQVTTRCLLLGRGRLVQDGPTADVVSSYLSSRGGRGVATDLATSNPDFHIHSVRFDEAAQAPGFNQPMSFDLTLSLRRPFKTVGFGLGIYNSLGVRLLTSRCVVDEIEEGKTTLSIRIPDHRLPPGQYALSLGIARGTEKIHYAENVLGFELSDLGVHDPLIQPYLAHQRDQIGAFVPGRWEKR